MGYLLVSTSQTRKTKTFEKLKNQSRFFRHSLVSDQLVIHWLKKAGISYEDFSRPFLIINNHISTLLNEFSQNGTVRREYVLSQDPGDRRCLEIAIKLLKTNLNFHSSHSRLVFWGIFDSATQGTLSKLGDSPAIFSLQNIVVNGGLSLFNSKLLTATANALVSREFVMKIPGLDPTGTDDLAGKLLGLFSNVSPIATDMTLFSMAFQLGCGIVSATKAYFELQNLLNQKFEDNDEFVEFSLIGMLVDGLSAAIQAGDVQLPLQLSVVARILQIRSGRLLTMVIRKYEVGHGICTRITLPYQDHT